MDNELKFVEVNERKRTYLYHDGKELAFTDVKEVCIRLSGSHRLNLANGEKVVVNSGWLAIRLDADAWSF
jgi:translation elongation factor P/translation initiation factor 5A